MNILRALFRVVRAWLYREAIRIAFALKDRLDTEEEQLTKAELAWLVRDVAEDLTAQIDDAENRSISAEGAKTMRTTRSVLDWLQDGRPAAEGVVDYLERCMSSVNHRNPSDDELLRRDTYLAAIGAAGGDVDQALRSWHEWEGSGDPEERRKFLAFQGRKLRAAMEAKGLTIGAAVRGSKVDTEILVSLMFGFEELRAEELTGLVGGLGLGLDLRDLDGGVRFIPGGGVEGQGIYVIDPDLDVPEGDQYPATRGERSGTDERDPR